MKAIILAYILLSGADAATTTIALKHGGREVLLPTQNPALIDALTAGQAASVSLALVRLHRTHPKLAVGMGLLSVGIRGFVVTHNVGQLGK